MLLETIENRLQSLLEGTLDRLLYPGVSRSLSSQLVRLIDEKVCEQNEVTKKFPDLIDIYVSPEKWDAWQAARETLDEVASQLAPNWASEGLQSNCHPRIRLNIDPDLNVDAVDIHIGYLSAEQQCSETALQIVPRSQDETVIPSRAYFIINGKETVQLNKHLLNIGRRSSNDIVLHDPLVSRDHVQLRAAAGHFILFDLSSTGGTFINNHPVKSATLKPGDVVRLGRTILIYNQEIALEPGGTRVILPKSEPIE